MGISDKKGKDVKPNRSRKSVDSVKKRKVRDKGHIPLFLPSNNNDLEDYITDNKVRLMDNIISSIEHASKNELPMAEIFCFDDSEYVITVSEPYYKKNLEHIYNVCIEDEYYELCPRVLQLISTLDEN